MFCGFIAPQREKGPQREGVKEKVKGNPNLKRRGGKAADAEGRQGGQRGQVEVKAADAERRQGGRKKLRGRKPALSRGRSGRPEANWTDRKPGHAADHEKPKQPKQPKPKPEPP